MSGKNRYQARGSIRRRRKLCVTALNSQVIWAERSVSLLEKLMTRLCIQGTSRYHSLVHPVSASHQVTIVNACLGSRFENSTEVFVENYQISPGLQETLKSASQLLEKQYHPLAFTFLNSTT